MTDKKKIAQATAELSQEAGIENSISGKFIFDESQVVQPVVFSCHKVNDSYCFGFLLPKVVPIYSGRGKNMKVIGREQQRKPAVITSKGDLFEPTNETENRYHIKYVAIPTDLEMRMDLPVIEQFCKGNINSPQGMNIFNSIKSNYEKFVFFHNPVWFEVHALWDIGTYFFQLFNSYPLLELRGLSGTGKSKTMKVSRLYTLNPTQIMVNPSEASLFRVTHSNRPTKYIDEAEKLFQYIGGQWQSSPVVELINGSYSRGSTVPRLEKMGNSYKLIYYGCYSPTMIGSIQGLRDATESRAITHIMTKAGDNDKRGELQVEDYENDPEYRKTRNDLYVFALKNWQEIEEAYRTLQVEKLKKRDFELWKPLLAIAKVLNQDLYDRVLAFAEKVSEQRKQDYLPEGSIEFRVLKIISDKLDINRTKIYMKEIAEEFNYNAEKKTAERTISAHLDKTGFKEYRYKDMKGSFIQIDKNVFETIVSPICPSLSSSSKEIK